MDEGPSEGRRPPVARSSSTSTSPVLGSPSEGLQRRNSWNRSREDIQQPQQESPERPRHASTIYEAPFGQHNNPRPFQFDFPSQVSLDSAAPTEREDEVHLTGTRLRWRTDNESHPEDQPRLVSRSGARYSESASPLRHVPTLKAVSRNLRRVSLRVVNLAGVQLEDRPIRLDDEGEERYPRRPDDEGIPELSAHGLVGRTLGLFGPHSHLRRTMLRILLWEWTEPLILLLIAANGILLTIQASQSVHKIERPTGYFKTWEDFGLFVLFVIFTLEAFARIIVSGLLFNPQSRITSIQSLLDGLRVTKSLVQSTFTSSSASSSAPMKSAEFAPNYEEDDKQFTSISEARARSFSDTRPSMLPGHTSSWIGSRVGFEHHPFQLAIEKQRDLSQAVRPYLRHSWNRIDFIAVTSYWIMFILAVTEKSKPHHVYLFRALSVLRVSRLLTVTSGTTAIMRSLKIAGPLLINVAAFVLFAMTLFSIVGVQSFKGSFRRNCMILSKDPSEDPISLEQSCGGFIDPLYLNNSGYLRMDGTVATAPKGFICPLGQVCQEATSNPEEGVQSFDNIIFGALQVFIIGAANQWSPTMYAMMDADFFIAFIFFIVCVIVLNFWLINLFVAVITNTFADIRAETKKSAFGAGNSGPVIDERDEGWSFVDGKNVRANSWVQDWYTRTRLGWVLLILADLIVQGTRSADSPPATLDFIDRFGFMATIAFDVEMVWRIAGYLPDWRAFALKTSNLLDLFLVISTSIIQIPVIRRSAVYPWLTIFQLARFYRVILTVPRMRPLLLRVFGNMYGLINMTLFLLLTNFLAALVSVQLFRGDIGSDEVMNFGEVYNSFLALYQVFTSENWTDILYLTSNAEAPYGFSFVAIIFVVGWFFFGNFIILQMFIAVINENFEVAEEHKKAQQFSSYLRQAEPTSTRVNWVDRFNPYRFLKAKPKSLAVESMPSGLVLPLKKTVVQENRFRNARNARTDGIRKDPTKAKGVTGVLRKWFDLDHSPEAVPMTTLKMRRESVLPTGAVDLETERHLEMLAAVNDGTTEESNDVLSEQRAQKGDFIEAHPTYDKSFWVLSNRNRLRYFCQKLVSPANGERMLGVPTSPVGETFFQLIIILAVFGGIIVATLATPLYRRRYYKENGFIRGTWFDIADATFASVLIVEFLVKITADGFIFTPNAYLLSIWNIIDFVILAALLANMVTTFVVIGGVSRGTRSLKAFRALRLITFFPWMRETFHSVLIAGASRIFDAALLALLYMVPYAVWGLNIFSGRMYSCNDDSREGEADCINEYITNPINGTGYGFLAPRAWDTPAPSTSFSFDNFGSSILILFEIVSLEGWVDVMGVAMGITEKGKQPSTNANEWNSVFFLTYNLLGAVVILTLFVSIIIGNFSTRSGMALLTVEQKRWIDLQKLIKRQRQSRRPKSRPTTPWRAWCFDRAVSKHGWWSRCMTLLYLIHIISLMTQTFVNRFTLDFARNVVFLGLSVIYSIDIVVRVVGLGWRSFRANGWNIFDIMVVSGSFATTLPILVGSDGFTVSQFQKLFLVSIAFKLVQKSNSLNQLFKTSVASLPAILKLLLLWMTLFLFFAITFVEVFGLTRWSNAETHYQNYNELSNALVMLLFMSTGEGWNQYMHNYAIVYPFCSNSSPEDVDSDCGSVGWAFCLFIAWNLLSMYIFVNMFTGLVVENFSYVFQLTGSNTINRQEMRAFKKVWASFDILGTGYLSRSDFVPFFAKLSGVFEVRIYPNEFKCRSIVEAAKATEGPRTVYSAPIVENIDIRKLAEVLNKIDQREIRRRRNVYNRLYHEALITAEPGKGISFNSMLILLAHYKLIDDDHALRLDEILKRRVTTEYVTDTVNLDRVQSVLKMVYYRRRYLVRREERANLLRAENQDIPAIVVDSSPTTPPPRSRDITMANRESIGTTMEDEYPQSPSMAFYSQDNSFAMSERPSPTTKSRFRRSDASVLSGDLTHDPEARQSVLMDEQSTKMVLSSLSSSVWGEMMLEAAEDD